MSKTLSTRMLLSVTTRLNINLTDGRMTKSFFVSINKKDYRHKYRSASFGHFMVFIIYRSL